MELVSLLASIVLMQTDAGSVRRVPGLTVRHYQLDDQLLGQLDRLFDLVPDQTPNHDRVVETLALGTDDFLNVRAPHRTEVTGWIRVEELATFEFRLVSDDGAQLWIDGRSVVDADGLHGAIPFTGDPIELEPGLHGLAVEHFDAGGASSLRLEWRPAGTEEFVLVPAELLSTEDDPTRVTSPGIKALLDDRRPGLGLPVSGVHPSYAVQDIELEDFQAKVGALAMGPEGKWWIATFDPLQRDERELPDIDSKDPDGLFELDPADGSLRRIATDLYEPSGICVVNGELYVAHRHAVEQLLDEDGDGFFETHRVVGEGWEGWNYHQFAFGLVHGGGKLYTGLSTAMAPPAWEGMFNNAGPNGPLRGGIVEMDLSSGDTRVIAGGTRTPNGLGQLSDGSLVYLDNQGAWMPASVLCEVLPGRFYGHYNWTKRVPRLAERFPGGGHPSVFSDRPRTPPALWLPQNEVVNSPTQPLVWENRPGGDGPKAIYPGEQILIGELTAGGLRRAYLERVDGVLQGALFRFSQGIEAGVNRLAFAEDGSLVVGCMGAQGNWNWRGSREGLQRLVPTGRVPFEIASVSAKVAGFELRFTRDVDPGWLSDVANYAVRSWSYEPTQHYGGAKVRERDHIVLRAIAAVDGRSVRLLIPDLEEGTCVHLQLDPTSRDGEPIWSGEAWYTLNRKQVAPLEEAQARPAGQVGHLPPAEAISLVHGSSSPTLAFEQAAEPLRNELQEAQVSMPNAVTIGPESGDLVSRTSLVAGRLHVEWFTPEGGAHPLVSVGTRELPTLLGGPEVWYSGDFEVEAGGRLQLGRALGQEGLSVLYRNIWFEPADGPLPVLGPFEDLLVSDEDWVVRGGEAEFALEDGVLVGTSRPGTPNTFYTSRKRYGDFELLYEFLVDDELNSGVQIRSEVALGFEERTSGLTGYQVEIDPSDRSWSAGVYEELGRGWLHPLHAAPYARRALRHGEWNRVRVLAEGPRIRTWINGVPAADLVDDQRATGHLGFQVHGVGDRVEPMTVAWRSVHLRTLSP